MLKKNNRAYLVSVFRRTDEKKKAEDSILELERLADTYDLEVVKKEVFHLRRIDPGTFLGSGNVSQIRLDCLNNEIDVVIFDEELSPQQQKNLEIKINGGKDPKGEFRGEIKIGVIDRTELILSIFEKRAFSKEARIQVELAECQYQLPRLKRMWTHLSRQRSGGSGGGFVKGEGEKQIEIDRRLLKQRIAFLKDELKELVKQRQTQRRSREKNEVPTFAIVGYTNAGKSTLLNGFTNAGVFVEDKLFATLDTATKRFILPNKQEILFIDTVGFIKKIPHLLVEAFKSTLEEVLYADILIHLVDVSNPEAEMQAKATYDVLKELKAGDKPIITCLNKIDLCKDKTVIGRLKLAYPKVVEISALKKIGFDHLLEKITELIADLRVTVTLKIPKDEYSTVDMLAKKGKIIFLEYDYDHILLKITIPKSLESFVEKYKITKR